MATGSRATRLRGEGALIGGGRPGFLGHETAFRRYTRTRTERKTLALTARRCDGVRAGALGRCVAYGISPGRRGPDARGPLRGVESRPARFVSRSSNSPYLGGGSRGVSWARWSAASWYTTDGSEVWSKDVIWSSRAEPGVGSAGGRHLFLGLDLCGRGRGIGRGRLYDQHVGYQEPSRTPRTRPDRALYLPPHRQLWSHSGDEESSKIQAAAVLMREYTPHTATGRAYFPLPPSSKRTVLWALKG